MKLLLDQNLSSRLLGTLRSTWPESEHIRGLGMSQASDRQIWEFAASNGYCLVSKDSDFLQFALVLGAPPKGIIVATGNASTEVICHCILAHEQVIKAFYTNAEETVLIIP